MSDIDVLPAEGAVHDGALQSEAAVSPGAHRTLAGDAGHARPWLATIELSKYLQDISAEQPCGPDLQYDADYIELARLMQGTAAVEYGSMRIEAAGPDWKLVKPLVLKLLARTRDLRLAVWLVRVLVGQHGFPGLADGLSFIETCIERYWDHVHPMLDEDNDPVERLNILVALDDMDGVLGQVRLAPLVRSSMFGPVCLRDIEIAAGEIAPRPDEQAPEPGLIEAAVHAVGYADVEACLALLEYVCGCLERIEALLAQHTQPGGALAVEKLPAALRHAARAVQGYLSHHPGKAVEAVEPECVPSVEYAEVDDAAAMPSAGADGDIRSRDDVARQLDRICEYYAHQEPGSPVPVLLQRAKRLINMNFIELMSELAPQGSAEIGFLLGIRPEMPHPGIDPSEAYSTH
ncbi:type VI secretion system protein TssA [Bordetella genomosp. 11]|uniref:type VI secretion system protein TssA n=1 Tax=Bordetella genomosp. 11 TaxID=1416808 RepID=UPI0015962D9A|nr:type VI secretion system protein TssA [Bordetella genomosp. 11]